MAQPKPRRADIALAAHLEQLKACRRCPFMAPPVVTGRPVVSKVLLVGQAPGAREPLLGKPFAWTAGKTLFGWFDDFCGLTEEQFRARIYMAAVCRCFPGKKLTGGDRVPSAEEVDNCSPWLAREVEILKPELVIPVGKLAVSRFMPAPRLDELIGRQFLTTFHGQSFDLVPLPHPSGASPWPRIEPGKTLLKKALHLICRHHAFRQIVTRGTCE